MHRRSSVCVDITQDCLHENKFQHVKKRVVYEQECTVQVICSRDEAVLIKGYCAQATLSLYKKKSNGLERICKHESVSESVMVVANIHVHVKIQFAARLF